jgi:DNA-binding phage protein
MNRGDDNRSRLETLTAARAAQTQLLAELDAAWADEILREFEERYPRADIAARAGISRARLYQILDEHRTS